jgi:hypothetical protein
MHAGRAQHGQATVEWVGLVLLTALVLGALAAVVPAGDGRSLGEAVVHAIVCAVRGDCSRQVRLGDAELAAVYGARDAALVRRYAPNIAYEPGTYTLPVDWRECRSHRCSDAPDRSGLDVHRSSRGGFLATAFTHLVRRGGTTYIQYWFYYPDSTTTWGGAAAAWSLLGLARRTSSYPGFHLDDWEGYQVRIDASGRVTARATSHDGYQYCKGPAPGCAHWGPWTGWTRVSRGSHAGHIPMVGVRLPSGVRHGPHRWRLEERPAHEGVDVHERVTTARGLRLVPLESIDPGSYRSLQAGGPVPPWGKEVYRDPTSDSTG